MKAGISNSLSARCAGACPSARTKLRRKKRRMAGVGKERVSFPKKMGRKKRKEGKFRKKVHKFSFTLSLCSKNEAFFSRKIRPFETKFLLLRLIKHNFPFIPPHCGVHIAQSRGTFPDHPAQTLFDLLNRRNFAISQPIGTDKKALRSGAGCVFTRPRRYITEAPQSAVHEVFNPLCHNSLHYLKRLPARVLPTNEERKEIRVLNSVYCGSRAVDLTS